MVRWEGEGPITHAFVHRHLRPLHAYTIQPVLDIAGLAPVDAYELPDRHRRAVRLRTPAEATPWSGNLSERVDADHVEAHVPADDSLPGKEKDWSTRLDNVIPLGRFAHRVKTHGAWTVKQPFAGIVLWRDPHGQIYLVGRTGTHKVTRPGATAEASLRVRSTSTSTPAPPSCRSIRRTSPTSPAG